MQEDSTTSTARQAELRWRLLGDNAHFARGLCALSERQLPVTFDRDPVTKIQLPPRLSDHYRRKLAESTISAFRLPSDPGVEQAVIDLAEAVLLGERPATIAMVRDELQEMGRYHVPWRIAHSRFMRNEALWRNADDPTFFYDWAVVDAGCGVRASVTKLHTLRVVIDSIDYADDDDMEKLFSQIRRVVHYLRGDNADLSNEDIEGLSVNWDPEPNAKPSRGRTKTEEHLRWHWAVHGEGWTARQVCDWLNDQSEDGEQIPSEETVSRTVRRIDQTLRPVAPWPPAF